MRKQWSHWRPFPDPRTYGELSAPFGAGVYELRNRKTDELVLFGRSKNVAHRMSSLLPLPFGVGGRSNEQKKEYVFGNLNDIEYRTKACQSKRVARKEERSMRTRKDDYVFST